MTTSVNKIHTVLVNNNNNNNLGWGCVLLVAEPSELGARVQLGPFPELQLAFDNRTISSQIFTIFVLIDSNVNTYWMAMTVKKCAVSQQNRIWENYYTLGMVCVLSLKWKLVSICMHNYHLWEKTMSIRTPCLKTTQLFSRTVGCICTQKSTQRMLS